MFKIFKQFKAIAFLLIAALFFGQALSYANVSKAETGILSLTTAARNKTNDTAYVPTVAAKAGDEVSIRLFLKNQSTTETLTDVKAKVELPAGLDYVPGLTVMERYTNEYITLPDTIHTTGVNLPELPGLQGAYVYVLAKVKDSATGTINPNATLTRGQFTVSDSTAKITINGGNTEVDPKLVTDMKGVNMGPNANPGDEPAGGWNSIWKDSVTAKKGDVVGMYILAFNDRAANENSRLKNVTMKASINPGNDRIVINGSASASNHAAKNDNLPIITSEDNRLDYVNGSARLYYTDPSGDLVSRPMPDSVLTTGVNVLDVDAGRQAQGKYLFFQLRLREKNEKGTIIIDKHLFKNGEWLQSSDPDKQVDIEITYPDGSKKMVRTGSNGIANVNDVPFGRYHVREILRPGFEQVLIDNADFTLSAGNRAQKVVIKNKVVPLVSPSPTPTPTPTPSVSPTPNCDGKLIIVKFEDKNGNGVQDRGEGPMANVEFTIDGFGTIIGPDGKPIAFDVLVKKTTDANGRIVMDVESGTYHAKETVPSGYRVTTANPQTAVITCQPKTLKFGNQRIVVVTPSPSPSPVASPSPSPSPTPSVSPSPTPTPSVSPTPSPSPTPVVSPTPTPKTPALQITKYVGNATRNEATDKRETKALAGETLNWKVVVKSVGTEVIKDLRVNDMLPANVKISSDFVITRGGNKFKLQDFTRDYITIGDLNPGDEITIEFSTVTSRDLACNATLVNTAYAEASNHIKIQSDAKAKIECVTVAGVQQPLVKTGSEQVIFSMVLSMLSVAGYVYNRQRKQLNQLIGRL